MEANPTSRPLSKLHPSAPLPTRCNCISQHFATNDPLIRLRQYSRRKRLSARTHIAVATLIPASGILAQPAVTPPTFDAFEVATIKPTDPDYKGGRFIAMQSTHVFA